MENLKNIAPVEDFNWEAYENGESFAGASHEDLEKAYDSTLNKVNDREVVDGTVIAMNKREVVVNIGYKSDGIIPLNEFRYNPDLKVTGTVQQAVLMLRNSGDLDAKDLKAVDVDATVNGSGDISCYVSGTLKCDISGSGDVGYKGNPVNVHSTGRNKPHKL